MKPTSVGNGPRLRERYAPHYPLAEPNIQPTTNNKPRIGGSGRNSLCLCGCGKKKKHCPRAQVDNCQLPPAKAGGLQVASEDLPH